jgi:hypothetical protein
MLDPKMKDELLGILLKINNISIKIANIQRIGLYADISFIMIILNLITLMTTNVVLLTNQ